VVTEGGRKVSGKCHELGIHDGRIGAGGGQAGLDDDGIVEGGGFHRLMALPPAEMPDGTTAGTKDLGAGGLPKGGKLPGGANAELVEAATQGATNTGKTVNRDSRHESLFPPGANLADMAPFGGAHGEASNGLVGGYTDTEPDPPAPVEPGRKPPSPTGHIAAAEALAASHVQEEAVEGLLFDEGSQTLEIGEYGLECLGGRLGLSAEDAGPGQAVENRAQGQARKDTPAAGEGAGTGHAVLAGMGSDHNLGPEVGLGSKAWIGAAQEGQFGQVPIEVHNAPWPGGSAVGLGKEH
jgi:hypothetical protein